MLSNMLSNAIKVGIILLYSLIVIGFYYFVFPHGQASDLKLPFLLITLFFYICYKAYYIGLEYQSIKFSFLGILSIFLLFLFFYCALFFVSVSSSPFLAIPFFFRILFFLSIPLLLHLLLYSVGENIRKKIFTHSLDDIYGILLSFGLGYIVLFSGLSLLALFSVYTGSSVLVFLGILVIISYKEMYESARKLFTLSFEFENHILDSKNPEEVYRPYLLSTEFLVIIVIGIIASNCISIFRPFPIGWDDLGVYMNYPKMLASAGGSMALGQMYPWQLYTGIGFLFNSQTLAFFLNSFSAVTAFFVTYLGTKAVLGKEKKLIFNIPLLTGAIFLSLPMVLFQVSKDMKLDVGLYTVSFLTLPLLIYIFNQYKDFSRRERWSIVFIIGLLAGLAFTIKITSLLLISGIIGVIAYFFLGYLGFLSYVLFYISIFTFLGLWSLMNVVFPTSGNIVNFISWGSFIAGISFLVYQLLVQNISLKKIQKFIFYTGVFLLGIFCMFLPWGIKNISEAPENTPVKLYNLIGGYYIYFQPDYSSIYSSEALQKIDDIPDNSAIDEDGNIYNEDFGRYFGYEGGINNYLKLPWNLTMQVNQAGEYTDITYIFLALIPLIFLLLPFKNIYGYGILVVTMVGSLLYFTPFFPSVYLAGIFSNITLPLGYLFIILMAMCSFLLFHYFIQTKDNEKVLNPFLYILSFTTFYVFLWVISAFGVVWYGIAMYGTFLLLFAVAYSFLAEYHSSENNSQTSMRILLSFLIFCIPSFYFFQSTIPYYLNTIKNAGFQDYKTGAVSENRALFLSHGEYIPILFALNIDDSKKSEFLIEYKTELLNLFKEYNLSEDIIAAVGNIKNERDFSSFISQFLNLENPDIKVKELQKKLLKLLEKFYSQIIHPDDAYLSKSNIYRVGTFMKYFITQNNIRLLDDSLLFDFDKYIYTEDADLIFERMKKLGIDYLLLDLNAATIDDDPRRDLTRRYENLLGSLNSEKIELIDTDSICLKLALAEKDSPNFMTYGGVNFESYTSEGVITRGQKFNQCHDRVIELLRDTQTDFTEKYAFLNQTKAFLAQNNLNLDDEEVLKSVLARYGIGYKALFRILE